MAKRKVTLKRVLAAVEADEFAGFCLACGADAEGIDPDGRGDRCDECGAMKVYGAEECLMMVAA